MGMMNSPQKCHLTDLMTENFPSGWDLVEYIIEIKGKRMLLRFPRNHKNSEFVEQNKYIIKGLFLNGKFPGEYGKVDSPVLDNNKLEMIIKDANIPRTPDDKINNLITYLHSLQAFEGSRIKFPDNENNEDLAKRLYFKNYSEMVFYLFTLINQGFITGIDASSIDGNDLIDIRLTYDGLAKVLELNESGNQSNKCFVAMSFSNDLYDTRNSIKQAIDDAGFKPILIDEIHIAPDVTINDALIAEIKKCKFMVADFTQHKHGVYFEAGFALGLKRPVIYLCRQDEFSHTHFDTNHYPHIIYSNLDELKKKLKTKIEAWIK